MSLDELSLESSDGWIHSQEAPREPSEKQKESSRRAQAQLQKVQKDEKKARADNEELFRILSKFIQNPLYSDLIPDITSLLQSNFPSRFLLFLIGLVYPEASCYLLEKTGQSEYKNKILSLHHYEHPVEFSDAIHATLRDWITIWLTAGEQFITHPEASVVLVQKFSHLITAAPTDILAKKTLATIFSYFFASKNVILPLEKSLAYSEFILSQLKTSLEASLLQMDDELKEVRELRERDLFGI